MRFTRLSTSDAKGSKAVVYTRLIFAFHALDDFCRLGNTDIFFLTLSLNPVKQAALQVKILNRWFCAQTPQKNLHAMCKHIKKNASYW